MAKIARTVSGLALAFGLGLAFVPPACLADALEGMRVPASAVEALTQQREQAEVVSPSSRGLMGDPMSAGAALVAALAGVELAPVVLMAAGVTIVVGVTVYVGEEVKRRKRRGTSAWPCL